MNTSCEQKVEHTKNGSDAIDAVSSDIEKINISTDNISVCANCGKEGSDVTNSCNKCKMVKYCNAACKKKHRTKHKKACERRVAELHDEKLFKQPHPLKDCPICMIRLPHLGTGYVYMSCCGKMICAGCLHAPLYDDQGNEVDNQKCAFCRTPHPHSEDEAIEREKIRVKAGDPIAIHNQGRDYAEGLHGFPQDNTKALELLHRAAELGHTGAYCSIGYAYDKNGSKVAKVDVKKTNHYYELAAIGGNVNARYNLGLEEKKVGNWERALKHFMIAIRGGEVDSLKQIQLFYSNGQASKEDYTKALQLYQEYLGDIKSEQRDEAAALDENDKYY